MGAMNGIEYIYQGHMLSRPGYTGDWDAGGLLSCLVYGFFICPHCSLT